MSARKKQHVVLGTASLIVSGADKKAGSCYDRLFDFCDIRLPGCGCDIVLLPEQFESRESDRERLGGPISKGFADLAKKNALYLIAPIPEKEGRRRYNTQAVFSPDGKCIHAYRKVHLAPGENKIHSPGTRFQTFQLPWFRAGILTCFDNQFPESSRVLALLGAKVLFWPSYGDLKKPHRNAARCLDNHVYLVSSPAMDRTCGLPLKAFEEGMVMDPEARVLAVSGPKEGLTKVSLPLLNGRLEKPALSRNSLASETDYLKFRRPSVYRPLLRSRSR